MQTSQDSSPAAGSLSASVRDLLKAQPWGTGLFSEQHWLIVVTGIGFLLRALHWQLTAVMFNDGPTFIRIAKQMVAGDFGGAFAEDQHPLYPFLIALAHGGVGNWEQAAAWVCIAGGTLCIPVLYVFFRDTFGPRIALLGALLYATQPHAVRYTADTQSEGIYFLFFFAAIAVLWKAVAQEKFHFAVLAGALAGGAYLTRPEGLGVVFVAVGLALFQVLLRRWRLLWGLGWVGAVILAAGLVMSPYLLALHASDGEWRLTRKKSVLEVAAPRGTLSAMQKADRRTPTATPPSPRTKPIRDKLLQEKPTQTKPERFAPKKKVQVKPQIIIAPPPERKASEFDARSILEAVLDIAEGFWSRLPAEVILFLLGCPFLLRRAREPGTSRGRQWLSMGPRGRFVLMILGFYLGLFFLLRLGWGYLSGRHVFSVAILGMGYAVFGIPVLGAGLQKLGERIFRRKFSVSPLWIGLAVVLCFSLVQEVSPYRARNLAERRVAEWFQASAHGDGLIAVSRLRVAYYTGMPAISIMALSQSRDAITFLRQARVHYVLIEDDQVAKYKFVGELFRADQLRTLHCEEARGRRACVYEYAGGVWQLDELQSESSN